MKYDTNISREAQTMKLVLHVLGTGWFGLAVLFGVLSRIQDTRYCQYWCIGHRRTQHTKVGDKKNSNFRTPVPSVHNARGGGWGGFYCSHDPDNHHASGLLTPTKLRG